MGSEIYHCLGESLEDLGLPTNVGDEGGFAPPLPSNRQAIEAVLNSIKRAGYTPGQDCFLALDAAATEIFDGQYYNLEKDQVSLASGPLSEYYTRWAIDYPVISIEDGLAEDDWPGWERLTFKIGDQVQVVGDDLYATNPSRLSRGIETQASNAILVKPNQIGTLTETLQVVNMARDAGWGAIISHRSGETEDTTIADLSVATGAGQIKSGAPARSERVAKYNRLAEDRSGAGQERQVRRSGGIFAPGSAIMGSAAGSSIGRREHELQRVQQEGRKVAPSGVQRLLHVLLQGRPEPRRGSLNQRQRGMEQPSGPGQAGRAIDKARGILTESTIDRPWESAPIPEALHLYECVNVTGWHDEAYYWGNELHWYEGDEKYPAAWLCDSCHYHIRRDYYGFDSPEVMGLFNHLRETPTLADEIKRRFGEGKWEWRPSRAMKD